MSSSNIQIAPSILSADFRKLEREVKDAEAAGADRIHCDVMDGHFVPNLTFGPFIIEAVRKSVSIPLDVHLMISNPDKYIANYCSAGANILMVHAETCPDLGAVVADIRKHGVKAGAAVNPDKPIDLLLPHLDALDQVLIMTVFAGFGGQKFMPEMIPKIALMRKEIVARGLSVAIEVDGGIMHETVMPCFENGATVFVAGSYVFGGASYKDRIDAIRQAVR
jgi:ribulose-phosphate 3-epimerase